MEDRQEERWSFFFFFKASCGWDKKTLKVKSVVCQVSQEWICAFSSLILISLGYSMTLSRRKIRPGCAILIASFSCSITPCNTLQHSVGTCFTILLWQEWLFEIYFSKYSHALSIRLYLCNLYVYRGVFLCFKLKHLYYSLSPYQLHPLLTLKFLSNFNFIRFWL